MELATVARLSPADRVLPVAEVFAPMLPHSGLQRGQVVGCSGAAGWSLGFGLISRPVATGSWVAFVGAPMAGLEAAGELGVSLERVVCVAVDGGPSVWAERVAAAADGFELIVTCPPIGAERVARRVRQRLQARGAVLLALSAPHERSPLLACDLELTGSAVAWAGIGQGSGYLMARRVTVRVSGRRVPRPLEREILLPCPNGRLRALDEHHTDEHDIDEPDIDEHEADRLATLERVG